MANQLSSMKCGPTLLLIAFAYCADAVSGAEPHDGLYRENLTYQGSITGDEITYTLYLPPEYTKEKRPYPIVFFLHGAGGGNASAEVLRSYEAARKSGHIGDCIIVFPEKFGGTVWRDGARDKMPETNVLKELLPFLEDKYSISKDRRHRTVMGFSMGAAGAIFWGAKYSDLFSVVVALDSGGGTSIDDADARNFVPHYAEKQDALRQGALRIRIVQAALNTRSFRASLDEMKIPYEYAQLSKNIDDYQKGSYCRNRRDPTRKMLHNPACLTEGAWGRKTWAFIGKNMGKGAKPQRQSSPTTDCFEENEALPGDDGANRTACDS